MQATELDAEDQEEQQQKQGDEGAARIGERGTQAPRCRGARCGQDSEQDRHGLRRGQAGNVGGQANPKDQEKAAGENADAPDGPTGKGRQETRQQAGS
jgi:hypothetical protein